MTDWLYDTFIEADYKFSYKNPYNCSFLIFPTESAEDIDARCVEGYIIHDLDTKSKVDLSYPKDEMETIQSGRAFHHGRFVMGLRQAAMKQKK